MDWSVALLWALGLVVLLGGSDIAIRKAALRSRPSPPAPSTAGRVAAPAPPPCHCEHCAAERPDALQALAVAPHCPRCGDSRCAHAAHHALPCRLQP